MREPASAEGLFDFLANAVPRIPDGPEAESGGGNGPLVSPLAGDGSQRSIYRVVQGPRRAIAVANPLPPDRSHPDENEAFLAVASFLPGRGIRVPAVYASDLDRGFFLLEDLGDEHLVDARGSRRNALYRKAIEALIRMQEPGHPPFDPQSAGNPAYTEAFILEGEAGYFHQALVGGLAHFSHPFSQIEAECRRLAREALEGTAVFMHRDFQSRNVMLPPTGPEIAIIDFQGARLGPPHYDLAALLFDPYARLSPETRSALAAHYRAAATGVPDIHVNFEGRLLASAANRLMQALGAFAKLGGQLRIPGFREHIPFALDTLHGLLSARGDTPRLIELIERLRAISWEDPPCAD